MPSVETAESRVLVLAPTGRDGALICDELRKISVACAHCGGVADLAGELQGGAGVLVVAEEALIGADVTPLVNWVDAQPPWSDLPLLLLTASGAETNPASGAVVAALGAHANVAILERPLRVSTLTSSVRSSLRARTRQLEVRDYLADRERAERQMLETQKLESLGVLAGGVAHDFNNLLTGILGNASLALDNLDTDRPIDQLLRNVVAAADRAADLTRQLLAYAGKGKFQIRLIDVAESARDIADLVQTSIPKGVTLLFDLPSGLPPVLGDPGQFQQIVMNLVINGAEAIGADKRGCVRVKAGRELLDGAAKLNLVNADALPPGEYVCLAVEDTGSGMSQETLSRIFDPFFTTKFLGRGLGLAAVLGIVRAHHGALEVDSRLGRGTIFRVFFPVNEDPTFQ